MLKRKVLTYTTLFVVLTLISSCVYYRFMKMKRQLNDFDKNFALSDTEGLSLIFKKPVLLKSDIVWLMLTGPVESMSASKDDSWLYILEKKTRSRYRDESEFDIHVRMRFNEKGKLIKMSLPERFLKYFSKSLFEKLLGSIGEADISKLNKEATSEFKGDKDTEIPTTREVIHVLGRPYSIKNSETERSYIYKYQSKSPDPEQEGVKIRFFLTFDKETDLMNNFLGGFKGIKINIDFSDLSES